MLDAVQEMLRLAGELTTNLLDDWLMVEPLRALYESTTLCSIEGKELPEILSCLLTTEPPLPAAKSADKKKPSEGTEEEELLMATLKTISEKGTSHLHRMLLVEEHHGKRWFREHRFSVLTSWLAFQTMVKLHPAEKAVAMKAEAVQPWTTALAALDMRAFLAGYELETFFTAK